MPKDANRKYFWRVYSSPDNYHYIDGFDASKANWMRFVNPAYSNQSQNLVACQVKQKIYFYTIKPVLPNQELLVWYCKEFAERLNYPLTGEQMLIRISNACRRTRSHCLCLIILSSLFRLSGQQLSPDNKDHFNTRLTPTEGSTRSDEGYHSNGFHDDHLTPPEDSSDSDIDNYVLDLRAVKTKKCSQEKEKEKVKTKTEV